MQPCDTGVIISTTAVAPCSAAAARWVLAATILGSSRVHNGDISIAGDESDDLLCSFISLLADTGPDR